MEYSDYGCRRILKRDINFWKEVYQDPDVKIHMNAMPMETDKQFWEYLNHSDRYVVYNMDDSQEKNLIGGFSLYEREDKVAFFGIVIHPNFRGLGLGKVVLEYLNETAKDLGIKTLKADVYEENLACISLLKSGGFKPIIFLEKNL
jgi:RimJ/RimL family protein N-acetyltransferase